jgi:hypothetical protein
MSYENLRQAWAWIAAIACLCLVSAGCGRTTWQTRREPYPPVADPYPVYRPAFSTPEPNNRFHSGYAGFNYGRLRDWGRVRPRPGEAAAPSMPQ